MTTARGEAGIRKERVRPGDSDTGLGGKPGRVWRADCWFFRLHPPALEDRRVLARPRKRAGKSPEALPSGRASLAGRPPPCVTKEGPRLIVCN
jgi:hypothetical protein